MSAIKRTVLTVSKWPIVACYTAIFAVDSTLTSELIPLDLEGATIEFMRYKKQMDARIYGGVLKLCKAHWKII